ncbi:MAG: hypothetical protein H7Y42_13350 [Chitinophagaceae bacterium]|nr:hypothetical protein [Chitinophagaceae bacterium]
MLQFKSKIVSALSCAVILAIMASFSGIKGGGEGFEIFLNNKLVLQQFNQQLKDVKDIQLDNRYSNDNLVIKYHHCGRVGKDRTVSIRNAQNKILKEWKFGNVSTASVIISDAGMACKVKDILSLQKANPGKLSLHYSSSELPKGRMLATLSTAELVKAK